MSKIKIYSNKVYPIKISLECERAWIYLLKCGLKPVVYLRQGGEITVINKAKEFKFKESKQYCPF